MGVGDTNSRLCGMKVAGIEVEVASRRGGGLVIDRPLNSRPAFGPRATAAGRNSRARDIDIRFAISNA